MKKEFERPEMEVFYIKVKDKIMGTGECTMGFECPDGICVTDGGCSLDGVCVTDASAAW